MTQLSTDVAVIGAGPTGLFQVFQAGMLKMKCHVFDILDFVGGQCQALYPEKPIYDIPAYPEIKASDLVDKLVLQAAPFEPVYHLKQQVVAVKKERDGFVLTSNTGVELFAKAIVIAAGCGAFGPNRPPLKNIESYEHTGCVKYLINNVSEFVGKKVVIAGGGDSALDWLIMLADIAEEVSIVHRRDKFRAAPHSLEKMQELREAGKIKVLTPYQLSSLKGKDGNLQGVEIADLDGNKKVVEANYLLPFYGLSMQLGPILDWGLGLDKKHITVDPSTMETSIEGIYAIGDVATYKNKLKLISVGFAEAAHSAHHFFKKVFPDQALHFEYSTSKGVGA